MFSLNHLGEILPNKRADLILFSKQGVKIDIHKTFVNGNQFTKKVIPNFLKFNLLKPLLFCIFQSIMETILIKKALFSGVLIEISFIFLYSFEPEINEVRYAARYSGRLSLVMYLLCFFLFKEAP